MAKIYQHREKINRNKEFAIRFKKDSRDSDSPKQIKSKRAFNRDKIWWETMVTSEFPASIFDETFNKKALGIKERKDRKTEEE